MLEVGNILSVRRRVQTMFPCHNCSSKSDFFCMILTDERETFQKPYFWLLLIPDKNSACNEKLQGLSLHDDNPLLNYFTQVVMIPILDIFAVFKLEPRHVFSLGISELFKECLLNYLCDFPCTSQCMCSTFRQPKTYNVFWRRILELIHNSLRDAELQSPGKGLKIDLSKWECARTLRDLYPEKKVTRMIKAKDWDSLEMVAPFLASIIYSCGGNSSSAPATVVLSSISNLVNFSYRRRMKPSWTDDELCLFKARVKIFKNSAKETFENYQLSKLRPMKWQALHNIVESLRHVGGF